MRLVIVTTHPIQYQVPLFRLLAREVNLRVVFMMEQTPRGHAEAGFGTEFEWDVPMYDGYDHVFAQNTASSPSSHTRRGIVLRRHEQLLRALKPDVLAVLGWFPHGYRQVIAWARRANVPLICRAESNLVSSGSLLKRVAKELTFRRFLQKFSALAVIGKRNRDFYRHYGVPQRKLVDSPYCIDTPFFEAEFVKHRPATRRPGRWRIGFSGKLIPKKRPDDLIAAVERAGLAKRVTVVLIGDGNMRGQVATLASDLGVDCELKGFLNQSAIVRAGYAELDLLVLPSGENETWGLVVNEAMTGGIPAIVSHKVGCAPDLVPDESTGYVFTSGKVDELADRLRAMVARLDAGHDFSVAVQERIAGYSLHAAVSGIGRAAATALSS